MAALPTNIVNQKDLINDNRDDIFIYVTNLCHDNLSKENSSDTKKNITNNNVNINSLLTYYSNMLWIKE